MGVARGRGVNVSGVTNPGRRSVGLAAECRGVTEVVCDALDLTRVAYHHLPTGLTPGVPKFYAEHAGALYFHPIPDKAYNLKLSWDGVAPPVDGAKCVMSTEWYSNYRAARDAALAERGAS